jgi:hypothetical protein
MGRPPIRKKGPFSKAEYQARWRKKKRVADARAAEDAKFAASRERRRQSRAASPIAPEFRVGDCRAVLGDITPDSVALILTDPPWADSALPLVRWLAEFASRTLMPGGSLLCFSGYDNFLEAANILAGPLDYYWIGTMLHDQQHLFRRKFIRTGSRLVLWFTKGRERRGRFVVQDTIKATRDKSLHPWQQGDAVWQWIEPLTDPGDLIVDPFAGSGDGDIFALPWGAAGLVATSPMAALRASSLDPGDIGRASAHAGMLMKPVKGACEG